MAEDVGFISVNGDEMIGHRLFDAINHGTCGRLIHSRDKGSPGFKVSLDLSKRHVARGLICCDSFCSRLIKNDAAATNGGIACMDRCIRTAAGEFKTCFFIASRFFPSRRFEIFHLDGNPAEPKPFQPRALSELGPLPDSDRDQGMFY